MKRGFVIILILAVLLLLGLLAITYLTLSLTDRTIARNYMDQIRAKMIAQSGVEYTVAKMQEDLLDTSWQYDRQNPGLNPSFKAGEVIINGQTRGYSQIAGSTYSANGDLFILKIDDLQSRININDGLANARVRANLARIINNLAKVIDTTFPDLGFDIIGSNIEEKRPQGGYSNVSEIKKVLTDKYGATGENYYKKLAPFTTTHAWQDQNVANPVPLSSAVISAYPVQYNTGLSTALGTINVYRYGRGSDVAGNRIDETVYPLIFAVTGNEINHAIYALDELNPQWIELVSRSPVNINTAPKEVLISLIKDLKGFFASDRRRNAPKYNNSYELSGSKNYSKYTFNYSQADPKGDELGFLYTTKEIDLALATNLADEIVNNRSFKTWRQFNSFCDSHAGDGNLLNDTRTIFYEYELDTTKATFDQPVSSVVARKQASQAMADVLKANFNPNLHLNETNPDANIKTLVDKTDLIVNSTEFCFTPMGYFEIESEGVILKGDKIIAQTRLNASLKLFDAARYTTEKQFLDGILVEAKSGTNNSYALEVGPEPANSFFNKAYARQNEWGGYIALSTVNGPDSLSQATFYAHFSTVFLSDGFYAKFSADFNQVNSTVSNVADWTESVAGPYEYNSSYRLARSLRKESDINIRKAPSDLRIDGAYVERHAGLAYLYNGTSTNIFKDTGIGMLCYWIKPWFHPETTGKPRTFFSLNYPMIREQPRFVKGKIVIEYVDNSNLFFNFFLPAHWPSGDLTKENDIPGYTSDTPGTIYYKGTSLVFGYSGYSAPGPYGGLGHTTPFLNHLSHSDNKTNYLKSGQWSHVACYWKLPSTQAELDAYQGNTSNANNQIWINGNVLDNSRNMKNHPGKVTISDLLKSSTFRIGEATYDPATADYDDWMRNWTCDSTVDEFYIFVDGVTPLSDLIRYMYGLSRYYRLNSSNLYETSFISGTLNLSKQQMNTPSWSTIESPSLPSGSGSDVSMPKTKIIGLSWTYYGEGVDAQGYPVIRNYKKFSESPSVLTDLGLKIKMSILKNYNTSTKIAEAEYGPFEDDEYSTCAVEMESGASYRYKVTFKIEYDPADPNKNPDSAVLLYSPIFDDITIFYTTGVKFLSYSYFD